MLRLEGDNPRGMSGAEPLVLDLWKEAARNGTIWIPDRVTNAWASAIRMALYALRQVPSIEVIVDCSGGYERSFDPCHELLWRWRRRRPRAKPYVLPENHKDPLDEGLDLETTTTVLGHAHSIGLSYSVCATKRLAVPDAKFAVHGGGDRWGEKIAVSARDIEGLVDEEDHFSADWLAGFTKQPYGFWLDIVSSKRVHEFGVAEALEWGVIDEVTEGV